MKILTGILVFLLTLYFVVNITLVADELTTGEPWYKVVNSSGGRLLILQDARLSSEGEALPPFVQAVETLCFPALSLARGKSIRDSIMGAAILTGLLALFIVLCFLTSKRRPKRHSPVSFRCTVCGSDLPPGSRFCDRCGARQNT